MTIKKHLFICAAGESLPRWKQAFASASCVQSGQTPNSKKVDFIWLRLQQDMPVAEQIQAARLHNASALLIVLSDTPNDEEAMLAFSAAARGYCNTHAAVEVLLQVAAVVSQGGLWIGESLMARLLVGIQQTTPLLAAQTPQQSDDWKQILTQREHEVALAIAKGASNKEVARQLAITERTVKAHVSGLFAKLDVQDRLQLALKIRG